MSFSFADFGRYRTGANNLTAAGNSQATAAAVQAQLNVFTTVPAGTGCLLPHVNASNATEIQVLNRGANALLVYPPPAGHIETQAANAPFSVPPGYSALFECFDSQMNPGQNWTAVMQVGASASIPPAAVISTTPPAGLPAGSMWYNPTSGLLYVYSGGQWVLAPSQNVNVKAYGAIGNGTTDDTAAIQNAAASLVTSGGGILSFPTGQYLITAPISVPSNTSVVGNGASSVLLAGAGFSSGGLPLALLTNQRWASTVMADQDITVRDIQLDWGSSGQGGTAHTIEFRMATRVRISNVIFQCRGAGNATALIGCNDTLTDGCSAYGWSNCAYDHWSNPQWARVVNCYGITGSAAQMVNFNPENSTPGTSAGNQAQGFSMANCHLVYTGASACPMQLEPLEPGTTVVSVTVSNNIFQNVRLAARGALRGVVINDNTFASCLGGSEVITSYNSQGGVPTDFTIVGNNIMDPTTIFGNGGVIRFEGYAATITGNRISGLTTTTPAISAGPAGANNTVQIFGNSTSNGLVAAPLGSVLRTTLLRAITTNATPVVATADGLAPGAANVLNIVAGYFCLVLRVRVVMRNAGNGATTSWIADNVIMTQAGSSATTTVSAATFTQGPSVGGSTTGCSVALTADTVNGGLALACTGPAATTIHWSALVEALQVQ